MKEIKLTIDGKEVALTEEQIKSLGLESKDSPKYNLLGQPMESFLDGYLIDTRYGFESSFRYLFGTVEDADWSNFKDKDSAIKFDKKLQALKELWDWKTINDGEFVPDGKYDAMYFIYYDYAFKVYNGCLCINKYFSPILPYFKSMQVTKKCISECKPQLYILFDLTE